MSGARGCPSGSSVASGGRSRTGVDASWSSILTRGMHESSIATRVAATAMEPAMQQLPVQDQMIPSSSSKKLSRAVRAGYGTIGKKVVIKANHFLVNLGQKDPHQYDVAISPEVTSKTKCREIMKFLTTSFGASSQLGNLMLAYDGGKSAFSAGPLPFESKEFVVKITEPKGREREFKVKLKFAAKKDLFHLRQFMNGKLHDCPQETIQALDVVLRESASVGREVIGRSLFHPTFGRGVLGDGIEFWKGFYQSLRPTQMGLSLNIDMSARAFHEPKLASDFVKDFLKKDISRPLTDEERIKVKKALRGVRVEVRRKDYVRRYKIQDLTRKPLNKLTFCDTTGASISVAQYFRDKHSVDFRYPLLPAIQSGPDTKPTYLPMEICWLVEGQRYAPKLNEQQVINLLRATCQRPQEREESVMQTMRINKYNQDPLVNKEFGLKVREQFTSIDARVLPAPPLKYHGTSEVYPTVGQWNMTDLKMINGGNVDHWAAINFSKRSLKSVERFCGELIEMCINKGIAFKPNPVIPMFTAKRNYIGSTLYIIHSWCMEQLARERPGSRLQLLVVILPEVKGLYYERIKRTCEIELGIVTQCCRPHHVSKLSKQYFENLSMKINVKVGGRNTALSASLNGKLPYITDRPTIIFGADVTHPSKEEYLTPSVAAVVASMDWPQVTKYKALVSAQSHRQEIIQDLYTLTNDPKVHGGMIRELLISFKKATGHKPHRIIFYRDGVSEGQFNEELLNEVDKIRKACLSLEENYMPPITFIIVQKRHHTRFFPLKHGDRATTHRSGNILPGTVVDSKICHPTEFDFYLCSHGGIQGTSRPAHYHVLYNENKFTANGLQMLTNSLCYTYARCTHSVSIVPPAYYAHLAAIRARFYIDRQDLLDSDSHGGDSCVGQRAAKDRVANVRPLHAIHENVKCVMFYC